VGALILAVLICTTLIVDAYLSAFTGLDWNSLLGSGATALTANMWGTNSSVVPHGADAGVLDATENMTTQLMRSSNETSKNVGTHTLTNTSSGNSAGTLTGTLQGTDKQLTAFPTKVHTTLQPTVFPTKAPTSTQPTVFPTKTPTTLKPTAVPTKMPPPLKAKAFHKAAMGAVERGARANTFQLKGEWREMEATANLSAIASRHRTNKANAPPLWMHPMCPPATDAFYFHMDGAEVGVDPFALLMEELRGKTILLTGDSLTLQLYAGWLVELHSSGIPLIQTEVIRASTVYNQGQVAKAFPTRVTFCPSFNFTMKNQEFFDLVTPPPFETEYVDERVLGAWQTIDEMMREVDVSVTNFGAHYDIVDPDKLRGQQRGKYTWGREIQQKRYGYMLHRIQEEKL
jgi:hypothetical protein